MATQDLQLSEAMLAELTDKQHEVLGLLLQHKTSKEIARELGISPHTVEQRLRYAKDKLGVNRRGDLATAYRRLLSICEKPVYDEFRIVNPALPLPEMASPGERPDLIVDKPFAAEAEACQPTGTEVRLVPAILVGQAGVLMRVGAVFGIAAAIMTVGIGGLAVLEQLSRLLA